ncbi:hypothetical protein BHE74_00038421 [Ensete ventricosum]|nr:hypothetical protein GW17_00012170 [Ensete ventricosum]RWW54963.1 hypothetical protein BHE74_00038421 [Ensete ventricosum]
METSRGIHTYDSVSKNDHEDYFVEDFENDLWPAPDNICTSTPRCSKQVPFKFSTVSRLSDEYDSGDDHGNLGQSRAQIDVNLKNVLGGIVAILTGRNKESNGIQPLQSSTSSSLFLGSEDSGGGFLHPSVYIPSAPPFLEAEAINYNAYRAVLEADPPEWLPDSCSAACMQCTSPFTTLTRGRHHCRFCGGIFCRACSKGRCLLPVKFRERDPQRVCDACYDKLDPLQGLLINSISNAMQSAKHDVMDWTCSRGWLNLPVGLSMEHEIYKAANTLKSYSQIGGELMDYIIVLHGSKAVKTFCSRMHFSLGAGLSAAAGPVGRVLEADLRAGDKGSGMCYTYSCSKGAFVGVSLEGNLVVTRQDANTRFYGDPYLTTTDILVGTVEQPKAALPLYAALDDLCSTLQC